MMKMMRFKDKERQSKGIKYSMETNYHFANCGATMTTTLLIKQQQQVQSLNNYNNNNRKTFLSIRYCRKLDQRIQRAMKGENGRRKKKNKETYLVQIILQLLHHEIL